MNLRKTVLLAAFAAALLPATAGAATPESGTIGPETPAAQKTTWTGTITDPLGTYDLAMFFNGGTAVRDTETCEAVVCDPYTLEVKPGGQEIRIFAEAPDASNVSLDITAPDGSRFNLNTVDYFTERELIYDAVPGSWTIRVYGTPGFDSFDYGAKAEINLPGEPSFYPEEEEDPDA